MSSRAAPAKRTRAQKTAAEEAGLPVSPLQILKDKDPKPRKPKPKKKADQSGSESDASGSQPSPSATSLLFERIANTDTDIQASDSETNTLQSSVAEKSNAEATNTYALVQIWDSMPEDVAALSTISPPAYTYHLNPDQVKEFLAFMQDKYPSSLRTEIPAPAHPASTFNSMVDKETQVKDTQLTPVPENRASAQPKQSRTAKHANGTKHVNDRHNNRNSQQPPLKQNRLAGYPTRKRSADNSENEMKKEKIEPNRRVRRRITPLVSNGKVNRAINYDVETGDLILVPRDDDEVVYDGIDPEEPSRNMWVDHHPDNIEKTKKLLKRSSALRAARKERQARMDAFGKLHANAPIPLPSISPTPNPSGTFCLPDSSSDGNSMEMDTEGNDLPTASGFHHVQAGYGDPQSSPFVEHPSSPFVENPEQRSTPTGLVRFGDQPVPTLDGPVSTPRRATNWLFGNLPRSVSRFIPTFGTGVLNSNTNAEVTSLAESPQPHLDPVTIVRPDSVTPNRRQRSAFIPDATPGSNKVTPDSQRALFSPNATPTENENSHEWSPRPDLPAFMSLITDAAARLRQNNPQNDQQNNPFESPRHFQTPFTRRRLSTIPGSENTDSPAPSVNSQSSAQPGYGAFYSEPSTGYRGIQDPGFNNSAFTWKTRGAQKAEKPRRTASNQPYIEPEVVRRVSNALEKASAEQPAAVEKKRKKKKKKKERSERPSSPDVIPNPPGCSYGMDLDYFVYDWSEDESEYESEEDDEDTPSSKRPRLSDSLPPPTPEEVAEEDPEELHHARPYRGSLFDKPVRPPLPSSPVYPTPYVPDPERQVQREVMPNGDINYIARYPKLPYEHLIESHKYDRLADQVHDEDEAAWEDRKLRMKREKELNAHQAEFAKEDEEKAKEAQRVADEEARVRAEKRIADEKVQEQNRKAEVANQAAMLSQEKIKLTNTFSPSQIGTFSANKPTPWASSNPLPSPTRTGIFDLSKSQPEQASEFTPTRTGSFDFSQSQPHQTQQPPVFANHIGTFTFKIPNLPPESRFAAMSNSVSTNFTNQHTESQPAADTLPTSAFTPNQTGGFGFAQSQPASQSAAARFDFAKPQQAPQAPTGGIDFTQSQPSPHSTIGFAQPQTALQSSAAQFNFTNSQQASQNSIGGVDFTQSQPVQQSPTSVFDFTPSQSGQQNSAARFDFAKTQQAYQAKAAPEVGPLNEQSPNVIATPSKPSQLRQQPQSQPRSILKKPGVAAKGPELSPLSKARANATMYTPKNRSGLGYVQNAELTPKSSPIPMPVFDDVVMAEINKLKPEDLAHVDFGPVRTWQDTGMFDQQIMDALEGAFTKEDREKHYHRWNLGLRQRNGENIDPEEFLKD